MANFLGNFSGIWQRTSLGQRVLLITLLLACTGASVLLVGWARKPTLVLLYSNLAPEEAGKIVEKVSESGAAYEIRDGGSSIFVAQDKVYNIRLSLASQGLPRGDQAGYRILDDEKIGISPFSQRVNYLRAIEGELAKTVGQIDGVVGARVHVVRPEEMLFVGRDKEATATVMLRLRPAWRLTTANVAAIVHLVAGSVEGLRPDKVVVVDSAGTLLSNQQSSELAGKAASFIEYKRNVEEYLGHKAEEMLAAALGPNRASVRVDAAIEMTASDQTTEKYDPANRVVTKEEIKSLSTSAPASTKEENTSSEYSVSKTVERRSDVPGKITGLTVAAFVDLSGGPTSTTAPAAPAAKVSKDDVEKIIRSAIGLKATDPLTVVDTPFYRPAAAADTKAEDEKRSQRDFYLEIARRSSLGVLVVGALLAMRIFRGGRRKSSAALPAGAGVLTSQVGGAALLGAEGEMDPELLKGRISRALQENPDEVKRLFLSWVESEKGGV